MRVFWIIVAIIIGLYGVGMFLLLAHFFYYSDHNETLEYEYHSRSIQHSIEKGVFVDSLRILDLDTIFDKRFDRQSDSVLDVRLRRSGILPSEAWIEKTALWKSNVVDLDSLRFNEEIVSLVVLFKSFKDGKPCEPEYGPTFFDACGGWHLVDFEEKFVVLNFILICKPKSDTIRLKTRYGQEIISVKY